MRRVEHPGGGSTLITSAPISANIFPQIAPLSSVRSSIRSPLSSSHVIAAGLQVDCQRGLKPLGTSRSDSGGIGGMLRDDEAAVEHRLHMREAAGELDGTG